MFYKRAFEENKRRYDRNYEPLPLQLPVPEPMPLAPRPVDHEEEKTERGIWTTDI